MNLAVWTILRSLSFSFCIYVLFSLKDDEYKTLGRLCNETALVRTPSLSWPCRCGEISLLTAVRGAGMVEGLPSNCGHGTVDPEWVVMAGDSVIREILDVLLVQLRSKALFHRTLTVDDVLEK